MKRIVITGALGHIGSRLIRDLPGPFPDAEIVMVDNLSTQRYCSLFNLRSQGRFKFLEADILQADLPAICSGADVVIHLAAITDAAASAGVSEQVEDVNCLGTERVALACIETGSPLVFASTTSIYGVSSSMVDEDCQDLQPQSAYAHSKLKGEQKLAALGQSHQLDYVICRMGTIFGVSPGMRFHTVINKFVWQACQGVPLSVWRTALNQQRPYLALGDAIEAMVFILRRRIFDRQIYNVVTTNTTVAEIIEELRRHVECRIECVDSPIMNQLSFGVCSDRFRSLGFEFTGSLSAGLLETVRLLRKNGK